MQSDKVSTANLMVLDKLGARLAIDDFGTAIFAMAHSLKMEVVAEGVETKHQLVFCGGSIVM